MTGISSSRIVPSYILCDILDCSNEENVEILVTFLDSILLYNRRKNARLVHNSAETKGFP